MPSDIDLPRHRLLAFTAVGVTLALLVLHLWAAAHLEFMFDEAYYRLWAHHLAWGYHDHPPAVAAWIRLSTSIFGQGEFGVRALGVFATALGAYAIYAIALDLFADTTIALTAALIWNACPLIGVGAILVTPDTPLLFGWTTALWGLTRVLRTGDWRWWLVVGVGAGLALEAKYTALFLGAGIVLAMVVVPALRRWWSQPAPYVGGLIALAMFTPNVIWNAGHGWQTFAKQFGRVADAEWTLRFLGEFVGSQIGLLNPLTFLLVGAGFALAIRAPVDGVQDARRLLAALSAPLLVFFFIHSLHDRVQGNWVAPLYPGLVLLAADAATVAFTRPASFSARARPLLLAARNWTTPVGLALTAAIYAQAIFAPIPLAPQADPTALLTGWRQFARDVDAIATRNDTSYILTQGYALAALLKVYAPTTRPVIQYNERQRWAYDPGESEPRRDKPGLFIVEAKRAGVSALSSRFRTITPIGSVDRKRGDRTIESYAIYIVADPVAPILDAANSYKR